MLPITWNNAISKWEVKTEDGKVLWQGISYADAAQFAEEYVKQQALQQGLKD